MAQRKIRGSHVYLRECLEIGVYVFLTASLRSWRLEQPRGFQVRSVFAQKMSSLSFWNHLWAPVQFYESVCSHKAILEFAEMLATKISLNKLRNWDTTQRPPNKLLSGSCCSQESALRPERARHWQEFWLGPHISFHLCQSCGYSTGDEAVKTVPDVQPQSLTQTWVKCAIMIKC